MRPMGFANIECGTPVEDDTPLRVRLERPDTAEEERSGSISEQGSPLSHELHEHGPQLTTEQWEGRDVWMLLTEEHAMLLTDDEENTSPDTFQKWGD